VSSLAPLFPGEALPVTGLHVVSTVSSAKFNSCQAEKYYDSLQIIQIIRLCIG